MSPFLRGSLILLTAIATVVALLSFTRPEPFPVCVDRAFVLAPHEDHIHGEHQCLQWEVVEK